MRSVEGRLPWDTNFLALEVDRKWLPNRFRKLGSEIRKYLNLILTLGEQGRTTHSWGTLKEKQTRNQEISSMVLIYSLNQLRCHWQHHHNRQTESTKYLAPCALVFFSNHFLETLIPARAPGCPLCLPREALPCNVLELSVKTHSHSKAVKHSVGFYLMESQAG